MPLGSLHIAPSSGGYEPYRSYDWTLDINLGALGIAGQEVLLKSVQVAFWPTLDFDEITLPYGNDNVKVPGKANVQQGQATFVDFVDEGTEQILRTWWAKHYDPATGMQYPAKNFKATATMRKSAPGAEAGTGPGWELRGIWMQTFIPGESADYGTSDVKKCQITFAIDRAIPVGNADSTGGRSSSVLGGRQGGRLNDGPPGNI